MNWCPEREKLGSSRDYLRLSGIGSPYFSVSGDDFETPSGGVWGDVPRLHRRWGTPTLGASIFLFVSSILFTVGATDSPTSCFAQLRDGLN